MSDLLEKILSGIPENTEEQEGTEGNKEAMEYSPDFEKEYGKKA